MAVGWMVISRLGYRLFEVRGPYEDKKEAEGISKALFDLGQGRNIVIEEHDWPWSK